MIDLRLVVLVLVALFGVVAAASVLDDDPADDEPPFTDEQRAFYAEQVQPLLKEQCWRCHGGGRRIRGGLKLLSRAEVLSGGDSGPAVDLEHPERSLLLKMLSYADEDHEMPPSGKLDDAQLEVFSLWVHEGLPFGAEATPAGHEDGSEAKAGRDDGQEGWSYRPLVRPEVPAVLEGDWVRTPLDAFVLARLEERGLSPAPPAAPITLLRRMYFDLTGLPAMPAEVDAFLADDSPDRLEKVADDLLSRPQYGEKWARHWLDLVRYAETNGYERDSDKPMIWRYRDWVIRAFNEDKPYDRMVLEQLAGDELDDADADSIIATGYCRLMQWDDEPGQGGLQARYDVLDDLAKTSAEAFLGMTIGCARCHDHKADPIPQKDYYRFMAFFHNVTNVRAGGNFTEIGSPEEREEAAAFEAEKKAAEERLSAELQAFEDDFRRRLAAHELRLGTSPTASDLVELDYRYYRDSWNEIPDFDELRPETEGSVPTRRFDLSLTTRPNAFGFVFEGQLLVPAAGEYTFSLDSDDGSRLAVNGQVVVEYGGTHGMGSPRRGEVKLPKGTVPVRLDFFQAGGGLGLDVWWEPKQELWRYTDAEPASEWNQASFDDAEWTQGDGGFGSPGTPGAQIGTEWHTPDIWLRRPIVLNAADAEHTRLVLHHDENVEVFLNGVAAFEATGHRKDYGAFELRPEARAAIRDGQNLLALHCRQTGGGQYVHAALVHRARIGSAPLRELAFTRRSLSTGPENTLALPELIKRRGAEVLEPEEIARFQKLHTEREKNRNRKFPLPVAFAVQEHGPHVEQLHVHVRGNAATKGEPVEPGFPVILTDALPVISEPAPGAKSSGRRRALAEWITRPDHPLTARVMVNRIWHHHFGRGIVRSTSDFGELGERPTHPKMLDWLACEFVARGWSIKELHRLILRSSVYRMSSLPNEGVAESDPLNDLMSSFDLRRLTAEELRDSVLAVNGRLNPKMFGPPFFAPMPREALETSSRPDGVWGRSSPEEAARRTIYNKVKRSLTLPLLASLDMADTDMACPERFTTTQPTQALIMLNGDFMNEEARHLATRLRAEAGDEPRDQVAFAIRLAFGRAPEAEEIDSHLALLGELRSDFGLSPEDALERLCLTILNLNEFHYLD